jgi:N-acetylneuraminic acid mutarotase
MAQTPCPEVQVIATGLLGPSKIIQTPSGNFLVAETGPDEPNRGRVSIVDAQGDRRTLLDGLPSARTFIGDFNGVTGLFLNERTLYVVNGQGDVTLAGPVQGTERANPTPASPIFSSVLAVEFPEALEMSTEGFALSVDDHQALKSGALLTPTNGAGESTTIRLIVDFPDYAPEPRPDFADNVRHSHPYGMVADDTHLYVVDAGFNNVRKVEIASGSEQPFTGFPPTPSPLPAGPPVIENVPTSIHWAGGELLVTTFGGAPFLPGYSTVRRVDAQTGAALIVAERLTTAIDAALLPGGELNAGFLTLEHNLSFPQPGAGKLRLFRTPTSTPITISACLVTPSSMLIDSGSGRLVLSELGTGRLISLRVPESLPRGDSWAQRADMPTARQGAAADTWAGKIYVFGGVNHPGVDTEVLTTVEEFDPATDAWAIKADMPTSRNWPAAAVVNGKIYVIGGDRTFLSTPRRTVEEYDPALDVWTGKTDMPSARSGHAAAVVEGKIYVMGGLTTRGAAPLSVVEVYDPVGDAWEGKSPMPTARGTAGVGVVNGKIFVIGGSLQPPNGPALSVVEMYDPQTDTWAQRASMPTARGGVACAVINGRIYAVGGQDGSTLFATVEEYDPATDTWAKRADMWSADSATPSRRWALSASEVNGRLFAIGGAAFNQAPYPTLALVQEYTPSHIVPDVRVQVNPLTSTGAPFVRVEWPSHAQSIDILQMQNQLQPDGWTDVEGFFGTGETLAKDLPAPDPAAFYRLQRELR